MSATDDIVSLNFIEHCLLRPDMYIGSCSTVTKDCWISPDDISKYTMDDDGDGDDDNESIATDTSIKGKKNPTIIQHPIKYNHGLERIIVEIKSNIEDNVWRSQSKGVPMKRIEVTLGLDPTKDDYGRFTFTNDGAWISVPKIKYTESDLKNGSTKETMLHPAEILFGMPTSGTNFVGDEMRKSSGRNGSGAKLTNIWSTEFDIEHFDPENGLVFKQSYRNNCQERGTPVITKSKGKVAYTTISFKPLYSHRVVNVNNRVYTVGFNYGDGPDDDLVALIKRHLYETAMITKLPVIFNGEKLVVKDLESYARLYYPSKATHKSISFNSAYGDECVVLESGDPNVVEMKHVPNISFINGMNTTKGGIHVEAFTSKIFSFLVEAYNARKPKKDEVALKTTATQVYPFFLVFVRAEKSELLNFDGQSKEEFLSTGTGKNIKTTFPLCEPGDAATLNKSYRTEVEKMLKWNWVDTIDARLQLENEAKLLKKNKSEGGRLTLGDKGDDANEAGKKNAMECVMYLTEGDSARLFASRLRTKHPSGRGTDIFGTFALRGKLPNCVRIPLSKVIANKEIKMITHILGLQFTKKYDTIEERRELRYGAVCILTDADDDGIHIEGLIIAFLRKYWPGLFKRIDGLPHPFFVTSMTTAVVIGTKGSRQNSSIMKFYSTSEYKKWQEDHRGQPDARGWNWRYIKGLGEHEPGDEKIYFDDLRVISFEGNNQDSEISDLSLAFDKAGADRRKEWVVSSIGNDNEFISSGTMTLSSFIRDQLVIYHRSAVRRAIPSLLDGLKVSQRKALFGARKHFGKENAKSKLVILAGDILKYTKYHHGEVSLYQAIIKMAQGFTGSNNIPFFVNSGEFGTRDHGPCMAAAARYLGTHFEDITFSLFRDEDDPILEYEYDNGDRVEFTTFAPILPTILINGVDGIGTGYSTSIPMFNPLEICTWIESWLQGTSVKDEMEFVPWYNGFKGTNELIKNASGKTIGWKSRGILLKPGEDCAVEQRESKATKGKGKGKGKSIAPSKCEKYWTIREAPIGLWKLELKEWLEYLHTGTIPTGKKKKQKKWKKIEANKFIKDIQDFPLNPNDVHWKILPSAEFTPDIDTRGNLSILQNTFSFGNMVVLDDKGLPIVYDDVKDILSDWCQMRIGYYSKRKQWWLAEYTKELTIIRGRVEFIRALVSDPPLIKMNRPEEEIETDMSEKLNLPRVEGTYKYLFDMPTRSLTKERIVELNGKAAKVEEMWRYYNDTNERQMWLSDIAKFKVAYAKFLQERIEE
jgi:DNA topoisomerase-2